MSSLSASPSSSRQKLLQPVLFSVFLLVLVCCCWLLDLAHGAKTLYTVPAGGSAEVDCSASRFSSCCLVGGWYSFESLGSSTFDVEEINGENEQIECKLSTTKGKADGCREDFGCKIICDTDCTCAGPFSGKKCGEEEVIVIIDDIREKLNNTAAAVSKKKKKKNGTDVASDAAGARNDCHSPNLLRLVALATIAGVVALV